MFGRDLPEDGEIVGEFGNSYLVDDGEDVHSIPRTPAYELAYIHDRGDLVFGDGDTDAVTFDGERTVEVQPTDADGVYAIQVDDGRSVRNPKSETDRVLAGLLEAVEGGQANTLVHLYEELRETQIDADVIETVQRRYSPVPPASVQITDDGWVIEDLFLLTWQGKVFLVTRRFDEPTYRIGGGVRRTDEDVEFIGLTPRGDLQTLDVEIDGYTLTEREMEFLTKAYWLATYRDQHDDDLFWDLIERHVQKETAQIQTTC